MPPTTEKKTAILADIAARAPYYTPEWRLDTAAPDAGAALAALWADMLAGTLERYELAPENYRRALLNEMGCAARPALPARGWLAFSLREEAGETVIPAGTAVSAPARPDAVLVTDRELAASPVRVKAVFNVIPARDAVGRYDVLRDIELLRAVEGEHIWTFSHPYAFAVSRHATLRLRPGLRGGGPRVLAAFPWEWWNGESWRPLDVAPEGDGLVCVFPDGGGEACTALRVRVTRGKAGGAVLGGVAAFPSGGDLPAQALYAEDTQQEGEFFYPFGQRFFPGNTAAFSCPDALVKPGARVTISFTLDYESFAIEGYPEREIRMRNLMRVSELTPPEEFTVTASQVKWEYWNGVGWAALSPEQPDAAAVFDGSRRGRVSVTFRCPGDLKPAVVGAHDLPFIRARLLAAENLYRQRGNFRAPKLSRVRFSYRCPEGVAIAAVEVEDHLDRRDAELPSLLAPLPDASGAPAGGNTADNDPAAVYFAFDGPVRQGTLLLELAPGGQPPPLRWEYLAQGGWTPLGVQDGTQGLRKTGLVSYQTAGPAVRARLWGEEAYWLRLTAAGETAGRRPVLRAITENAVPATAREPGETGVLPSLSFTTLAAPLPGVERAFNPLATYGGVDTEGEEGVIARYTAAFSHRGRAVSGHDLEALACEASPRVVRARCYLHTDERGDLAYGHACVALLTHQESGDTVPLDFAALRDEAAEYLSARRPLGAGPLHIVPPRYIAVNVSLRAALTDPDEALSVRRRIGEALAALLNPLDWQIGQLPTLGHIETALRGVAGIAYIIGIKAAYLHDGIPRDYAGAIRSAFVLPVNGTHEIGFV